jgi:choline dehydrogenase
VYPAFKKSCHFTPPDYSKIDKAVNITWDPSAFDENGGPLHVSYSNYQGPYGPSLHAAMEQSGLNSINGFNSGRLIGYSTLTATIDPHLATRSSSETSFLQEAARRSSIKIYPQTLAKRVTFDSYGRANGIDVEMNTIMANETYHLSARKEVILSAGVVSCATI